MLRKHRIRAAFRRTRRRDEALIEARVAGYRDGLKAGRREGFKAGFELALKFVPALGTPLLPRSEHSYGQGFDFSVEPGGRVTPRG